MRWAALTLAVALGGCDSNGGSVEPSIGDVRLIGELTLHELLPPDWTHAWAAFLDPSGPLAPADAESALTTLPEPTPSVGTCEVITAETCQLRCPPGTICRWNRCETTKPQPFVEAGLVHVTGGRGPLSPMSLAFGPQTGIYGSVPPPGPGFLFTGGEIVDITFDGGGPLPGMHAQFESPAPLEVTEPDLEALHLPTSGPLHLAWNAAHRTALELALGASSNTNADSRIVRCTLEDNGAFDVAPEILGQLPPPPRSIHLELSRLNRQVSPAGLNRAVLIHGGFTAGGNGSDEE
jgi:hypothetical protein